MKKKLNYILPAVLVVCAVLFLFLCAGSGSGIDPESDVLRLGSGEPMDPAQTDPVQVERILEKKKLVETARPISVYDGTLNWVRNTGSTGEGAVGYQLAEFCSEQRANPVAVFWLLVSEGVYEKEQDTSGVLPVCTFEIQKPEAGPQRYEYSAGGARRMIENLLELSREVEDELALEQKLLGWFSLYPGNKVLLSEKEGCYYTYGILYGKRTAHFLCIYLRGDAEGKWIDDLEIQLLNLYYVTAKASAREKLLLRGEEQTQALMAAAELLMTGQTALMAEEIPFRYEVGDCTATVERYHFTGNGEEGTLTNYRLRVKD